jgi:hypothetical protein
MRTHLAASCSKKHMHTYTCMHIAIHTYTCTYIGIHTYTCTHIAIHTYTCTHIGIHTYTCTHIGIHTYTCMQTGIHTCTCNAHRHTYIHMAYKHTTSQTEQSSLILSLKRKIFTKFYRIIGAYLSLRSLKIR